MCAAECVFFCAAVCVEMPCQSVTLPIRRGDAAARLSRGYTFHFRSNNAIFLLTPPSSPTPHLPLFQTLKLQEGIHLARFKLTDGECQALHSSSSPPFLISRWLTLEDLSLEDSPCCLFRLLLLPLSVSFISGGLHRELSCVLSVFFTSQHILLLISADWHLKSHGCLKSFSLPTHLRALQVMKWM